MNKKDRVLYQIGYGVLNWVDATTYLLTLGFYGTELSFDFVVWWAKKKRGKS